MILTLLVATALTSCDFSEKTLPEEKYLEYCYTLAEEYNEGGHKLSEYFDLQLFSDKVSGQMNEYLGRRLHIANGTSFADNVDTYINDTDVLVFNKLKEDKQGRIKAVFFASVSGFQNYMEMELSQTDHRIYIADLYDYVSGAYLSELTGQAMALANKNIHRSSKYAQLSYNPLSIYEDLILSLSSGDVTKGWKSYNQLQSEERKMKLFDFFRINLALSSPDSVYMQVVDAMLSETKRDPRFFYIHRFDYFQRLKDYPKALEQLKKLSEYTGINAIETSQLGLYCALAGKYEEAFRFSKDLEDLTPDSRYPLMQNLLTCYLMGNEPKFEANLNLLKKEHSLSGEELWLDLYDSYVLASMPQFEGMASWIIKDDSL